jgi:hypothetical protein
MKLLISLAAFLALAVSFPVAAEPGYLLVQNHAAVTGRDGAQPAELFVYREDGEIVHSGDSGGQFIAGDYVELDEGWYFIEVGRYRAPANAVKMYVAANHVTVVPTGWVSVRTDAMETQPSVGCRSWNAELSVFARARDGSEVLTSSNRGSGVRTWGAVQLLAGEQLVSFNEVPATVIVVDNTLNELPTGFQGPVFGSGPQLALTESADGLRLPLCEDGALQVPAGTYWAAGAVTIDVYPYERRDWAQVVVQAEEEPESETLRVSRLSHPRFEGEGSAPVSLTEQEFSLLAGGGSGSGVRLNGFGR